MSRERKIVSPAIRLSAIVLFAIVTVEFGGWSLLGFLTGRGELTSFEEQFFRAGHGHAGVLLVLGLVYLLLMDRARFSPSSQWLLGALFLTGVLAQSGGFFVHFLIGEEGVSSPGTWVTTAGGLLLAVSLVSVGIGLLRSGERAVE
jgi:hypothetical protein